MAVWESSSETQGLTAAQNNFPADFYNTPKGRLIPLCPDDNAQEAEKAQKATEAD